MAIGFELSRRHVSQRPYQAVMAEPGQPLQRGRFHRLFSVPRPAPMDHLGHLDPIDCLGQRVVVSVAVMGLGVAGLIWLIGRRHRRNCVEHRLELERLLSIARPEQH